MATKIHVGFKDGKLTSGKCEADKGKCPYGNHFPSQSEADKYQEHVAEILHSPQYRDLAAGYETYAAEGGGKMTTQDALGMGFPEEVAKLIGGEPTDPKYARENVGVEAIEEPVAVEAEEVLSPKGEEETPIEEPAPKPKKKPSKKAVKEEPAEEIVHDTPPEKFSLSTPRGQEKLYTILNSYKKSSPEDFTVVPPAMREYANIKFFSKEPDPEYEKLKDEYTSFAKGLAALRANMDDQLSTEDKLRMQYLMDSMNHLNASMQDIQRGISEEMGWEPAEDDGLSTWRSIANYGEEDNDVNDRIVEDLLARRVRGESADDRQEAYDTINGNLLQRTRYKATADEPPAHTWEKVMGKRTPWNNHISTVELNKLAHHQTVNAYSDMLADGREAKKAADARKADSVDELKAKSAKLSISGDKAKPIYDYTQYGDTDAEREYYQRASERTKARLKPGAYVMLAGLDAEAYQIAPDGGLKTTDGKLWGYVDFKTGAMYDVDGQHLGNKGGARVYANTDELLRYAALDNGPHDAPGSTSADPGYKSRYETDPKHSKEFQKVYDHLRRNEQGWAEVAKRNQETELAVHGKDGFDLYDEAVSKYGMKELDLRRFDVNPNGEKVLKNRVKEHIAKEINEGRLAYDFESDTLKKVQRDSIESHVPKEALDEFFASDTPPATRASIMSAARRKRELITAQADQFAGTIEEKPTEYSAIGHRRRSWVGGSRIPLGAAKSGNLIYMPVTHGYENNLHETYVVVDHEKNLMVPVTEGLTPESMFNRKDRGWMPSPVTTSEYTVQNLLRRYKSGDPTLDVREIPNDSDDAAVNLRVW